MSVSSKIGIFFPEYLVSEIHCHYLVPDIRSHYFVPDIRSDYLVPDIHSNYLGIPTDLADYLHSPSTPLPPSFLPPSPFQTTQFLYAPDKIRQKQVH